MPSKHSNSASVGLWGYSTTIANGGGVCSIALITAPCVPAAAKAAATDSRSSRRLIIMCLLVVCCIFEPPYTTHRRCLPVLIPPWACLLLWQQNHDPTPHRTYRQSRAIRGTHKLYHPIL